MNESDVKHADLEFILEIQGSCYKYSAKEVALEKLTSAQLDAPINPELASLRGVIRIDEIEHHFEMRLRGGISHEC